MWEKLCQILDKGDLIQDARFRTNPDRVRNKGELRGIIEGALARKPTEEWVELLNAGGIAAGPIYTVEQVFRTSRCGISRCSWRSIIRGREGSRPSAFR